MKTIICKEPGKMQMIETESATSLDDYEVLISVKRIGICGTDIHAYEGNQPFFTYPRILGHEISGVIEEVGKKVTNVHRGDKVAVIPYIHCGRCFACLNGKTNCCTDMKVLGVHKDGGMKEYLKVPEDQVIVTNQLSLDEAAIVEPLSIGYHSIRRADIKKGETVLIIGAGPIGLGVVRFSKIQNAKTIIMDINEERLEFCKEWAECDYVLKASENAVNELLKLNNGQLPSIVIDATGNKHSMMNAFNYVSSGGKLIYVGLVKDNISFNDPDFHSKELTLMGSRNATKKDFEFVIQCLGEGKINASSYISSKIPFEETVSYFEDIDLNVNKSLILFQDHEANL
ncbi:MAG: zinc-binding alcohol dehydrogenase family protein [Bacillota bacterium]